MFVLAFSRQLLSRPQSCSRVSIRCDSLQILCIRLLDRSLLMDPCGMCVIGVPHTWWSLNAHNRLRMGVIALARMEPQYLESEKFS